MSTNIFNVYNQNGVRIFAKTGPLGYQLIKYDFNRIPAFDANAGTVSTRGEFLRKGRFFSTTKQMYRYLMLYKKHNIQRNVTSQFDSSESKKTRDRHKALFGRNFNM